jgi:DNA-directed RNA polymerase II subunit RPB1
MEEKRLLTKEEKIDIVSFLTLSKSIPRDCAETILRSNRKSITKQLKNKYIYPHLIPEIKVVIEKQYYNSLIHPGEMVGVICAQALGEKQTQMTLNSFHHSGISNKSVTTGVPRFRELIDTSKKPKISNCKIYFDIKPDNIDKLRAIVTDKFRYLSVEDITKDISLLETTNNVSWHQFYREIYNDNRSDTSVCLRLTLRKRLLFEYKIDLEFIASLLEDSNPNIEFVIFSPLKERCIDVFISDDCEETIGLIKSNIRDSLSKMKICGIQNIKDIFFEKEGDEWILETTGTNPREVLNIKGVNYKRTISTNIWEIYDIFGIEAVREYMITEFCSIMEGVNRVHVELLVERMTFSGTLSSITRYTMRKDDTGPLAKASFEECVGNFINASVYGDVEPMNGVSSAIICGKQSLIGTGMMSLSMDMNKICKEIPEELPEEISEF